MKYLYIISAIILVQLSACTKDATNVKLPKTESKLVAQSFLGVGDTVVKVYVSQSTPVFGTVTDSSWYSLLGCQVTINDGSKNYTLNYDNHAEAYVSQPNEIPIQYGQSFTLEVKDDRGRVITSSCTTPFVSSYSGEFISIDSERVAAGFRRRNGVGKTDSVTAYHLKLKVNDDTGMKNYYRILCSGVYDDYTFIQDPNGNVLDSTPVVSKRLFNIGDNKDYIDDADMAGGEVTLKADGVQPQRQFYNGFMMDFFFGHYKEVELLIINGNADYYKYQVSVGRHLDSQGNPFAEPALVYSNITGGIGIFAAYSSKKVVKKL